MLRGPQGTLFGKNASAGVVNVVTKKPGDEFGGYIDLLATDDEEYKARFALDVPFTPTLRARITGSYGEFDGRRRKRALVKIIGE